MKSPALKTTIKKELFSFSSVLIILIVASLYIILSTLLLNYRLLLAGINGGFPLTAQFIILIALLQGAFNTMHIWDSALLVISGLLVGVNILFIGKTIYILEHLGKVKLSIGGAAILSLITTGCASCGLSILSVLGISFSFSFLPFHGLEIHIVSVGLLALSGWYMLKKIHEAKYCKI